MLGQSVQPDENPISALQLACERDLGDPDLWFAPDGYPESLALCIIDAIYSTGARYSSVINVVQRYRQYRAAHEGNAETDGTTELTQSFEELGGPDPWATQIGNRRPTSTSKGAPLKSVAIAHIARELDGLAIKSAADLRAAAADGTLAGPERVWRGAPGQGSGLTWDYGLMLARVPGVKADRMVIRYAARAVGRSAARLSPTEAAGLVKKVAGLKGWDVIRLDHAIWRFESGRDVNRNPDEHAIAPDQQWHQE